MSSKKPRTIAIMIRLRFDGFTLLRLKPKKLISMCSSFLFFLAKISDCFLANCFFFCFMVLTFKKIRVRPLKCTVHIQFKKEQIVTIYYQPLNQQLTFQAIQLKRSLRHLNVSYHFQRLGNSKSPRWQGKAFGEKIYTYKKQLENK